MRIEQMPAVFAPPGGGQPGHTHLQMIVGGSAMRPGMGFANTTDGTANTFAVVEAADPVIWTKPDDIMLPPIDFTAPFPGRDPPPDFKKRFGGTDAGFHALFWDGSVRFIKKSNSDKTLWLLACPADGEKFQLDQ